MNSIEDKFVVFEPVETPKIEINLPLFDTSFDISDWSQNITENNIPIVKSNLRNPLINNNLSVNDIIEYSTDDNPVTTNPVSSTTYNKTANNDKLSKLIDEVSQESGYEGLKDPNIKNLLMLQAKRESSFNSKAISSSSTACGYFLFIDGTRRNYSTLKRNEFLNNPKELVRAAYKLLKDIHNMPSFKKLLDIGYNEAQATALGWWYPKSMDMVLNGLKNFSLGGYSIKKALSDYKS